MAKVAVQILYFNAHHFIGQTIKNCAPHVDKIYVLHSQLPWSQYNTRAREKFVNQSSLALVEASPHRDKIEVITGVWDTEEQQREHCRLRAVAEGFDFLIVQDADEFYTTDDYQKNLAIMKANPGYEVYQTPWVNFWKSVEYVLVHRHHLGVANTIYGTCPLFAINLKLPVQFESRRVPRAATSVFRLPGVCLHLSYVFSDMDLFTKIGTWGHSHQVNKNWFKWKWLAWHLGKRNLNPISSVEWPQAVRYKGHLPPELTDFINPQHVSIQLNWCDQLHERLHDSVQWVLYYLKKWWFRLQ
jgi:hypothetical protein